MIDATWLAQMFVATVILWRATAYAVRTIREMAE